MACYNRKFFDRQRCYSHSSKSYKWGTKKLIETELLLTKSKKSLEEVDNLSSGVKEKYKNIDRDLSGLYEGKKTFIDRLSETNARLDSNNKKYLPLRKGFIQFDLACNHQNTK